MVPPPQPCHPQPQRGCQQRGHPLLGHHPVPVKAPRILQFCSSTKEPPNASWPRPSPASSPKSLPPAR
jgi:hypothetical protein